MPRITISDPGGKNVEAFLDMLALSELGPAVIAGSDDGYNVLVGSTPERVLTFASYLDHPNVLNAALDSTAAGRYQELHANWLAYGARLQLPDFGPISQDRIAVQQLREAGAYDALLKGLWALALARSAHLWASLPGNDYRQPQQKTLQLLAWYTAAGGQRA